MQGISNVDGRLMSGSEHLQQSVKDILTTPIGSRVMLRDYGFDFSVLALPQNDAGVMQVIVAVVEALNRWEPRLKIIRVTVAPEFDGAANITIEGEQLTGEPLTIQVQTG